MKKKVECVCIVVQLPTLVLNVSLIVSSDESGMYPIFGFSGLEISMEYLK